jgi:hypothetical protein
VLEGLARGDELTVISFLSSEPALALTLVPLRFQAL